MNQPLEIIPESNISLNQLAAQHAAGFSVMRSAHVGNAAPYNMTIASLGIPMLLVDHTVTGRLDPELKGADRNYFPEAINTQGGNTIVAPAGRLACRSQVQNVPAGLESLNATGWLDDLHVTGLRAAVPDAEVVTNTNYLRQNEKVAGEIIDLAAREMPGLFTRIVDADGRPVKVSGAAYMIRRAGVLPLNDDPRAEQTAVLIPNAVDIVTNFVIEALRTERDVQYHLSGPDMISYLRGHTEQLKEVRNLYALVKQRASFGLQLPPTLTVRLVTSADARFATTTQRKANLDNLLDSVAELELQTVKINQERKQFFGSPQSKDASLRAEFLARVREREAQPQQAALVAADATTELFTPERQLGAISQYDVLCEGGLYVPKANVELPLISLSGIRATIAAVQKGRKP